MLTQKAGGMAALRSTITLPLSREAEKSFPILVKVVNDPVIMVS